MTTKSNQRPLKGTLSYLRTKQGNDFFEWQYREYVFTFYVGSDDEPKNAYVIMYAAEDLGYTPGRTPCTYTSAMGLPPAMDAAFDYFVHFLNNNGGAFALYEEIQEVKKLISMECGDDD